MPVFNIEIASGQENITFIQQFLKKPTNSIVSIGWGITPPSKWWTIWAQLLTGLKEAMRREMPILFYYWAPEWPFDVLRRTSIIIPVLS
jgi:hypothetical protein